LNMSFTDVVGVCPPRHRLNRESRVPAPGNRPDPKEQPDRKTT
jgi:hypothetical protein